MTDSPPLFIAHDVPDLINTLPTLFGFPPEESLVAIATHGPRRRFGFRMRVDLPGAEAALEAGDLVVQHLRNQGADGAIVIALSERQDDARAVLDAIHRRLDEVDDIELVVRARADARTYWTDQRPGCDDGSPYERSMHHVAIVQAVAAGQQILSSRDELVNRFRPVSGPRRSWLEQATAAITDEVVPQVARSTPSALGQRGMTVVGPILDRALAGEMLSDGDLLRVAAWVSCIKVRDEVWMLIDRENAATMLALLTQVAQRVVPPYEPAVLSLAAFAAWLTGDGAQALIAVERALDADPCYSMALSILQILENGIAPSMWSGGLSVRPR